MEGRKTTRVSWKSPGIGQAANERDAKSMIFASQCYWRPLRAVLEKNPRARQERRGEHPLDDWDNSKYQYIFQKHFFYKCCLTNVCLSYGGSTQGVEWEPIPSNPVVTLGDYFQILSNELSISVPPPPSQPFQLSKLFYITFCTGSHGAAAKTKPVRNMVAKHQELHETPSGSGVGAPCMNAKNRRKELRGGCTWWIINTLLTYTATQQKVCTNTTAYCVLWGTNGNI